MAHHSENENWLVVINVWDADQEGAGAASRRDQHLGLFSSAMSCPAVWKNFA
jgi:hypothetical protein